MHDIGEDEVDFSTAISHRQNQTALSSLSSTMYRMTTTTTVACYIDENSVTTDALHLLPLTHINHMRPSFRHVDEQQEADDNIEAAEPAEEQSPEKKPVIFQRKESERTAMARKSSYAFKRASDLTLHSKYFMDDSNVRANIFFTESDLSCHDEEPIYLGNERFRG